ncbi:hypothetical protein Q3G72_017936 [Acer saccharum]|nr:hypothetical protein Q3G72_017936 [Acer saccharum]
MKFSELKLIPYCCALAQLHKVEVDQGGCTSKYGGSTEVSTTDPSETEINDGDKQIVEEKAAPYDDHLTPAERRYIDQRQKLDVNRLAKESNKSHRDRIQDFNQYLANMSEHYDIPKVGPAGSTEVSTTDPSETQINDADKQIVEEKAAPYDDHLTPAERRYIDQRQKLDVNRLAKESNKSHRDRIQDFNQYLANMSEHYDIPKVGPG